MFKKYILVSIYGSDQRDPKFRAPLHTTSSRYLYRFAEVEVKLRPSVVVKDFLLGLHRVVLVALCQQGKVKSQGLAKRREISARTVLLAADAFWISPDLVSCLFAQGSHFGGCNNFYANAPFRWIPAPQRSRSCTPKHFDQTCHSIWKSIVNCPIIA